MAQSNDTKQPDACPQCGSKRVASILYGLPMFNEELERRLSTGEIVLGGCCVCEDDPICALSAGIVLVTGLTGFDHGELLGDPVHEQVEEIVENHHCVPGASHPSVLVCLELNGAPGYRLDRLPPTG